MGFLGCIAEVRVLLLVLIGVWLLVWGGRRE